MNRAERRRQAKRKRSAPPSASPLPTVAILKATLQRLSSPAEIGHYLDTLIAQGLPPAAAEELRVYGAEFHDATAILQSGTDRLSRLIANAQGWADTLIDQSPQKNQRACHAGCAWCCYLPVVLVTTAEALHLAGWLHNHCSDSELDALRHRLSTRLQRQQAPAEKDAPPLACPLLRNNRCMAYEARPLKCRAWNSLRLADCEQAYGHGSSARQVRIDTSAFVMGNAVLSGLSDGVTQAGLDGSHHELCQALDQALTQSDGAERWQQGEQVLSTQPR
ncbi:MAG: hypothetical protein J4F42_20160 [Desulfurellaceae bacterium]|nr:hypothetical protein [Desulfurellaceae bacterium]